MAFNQKIHMYKILISRHSPTSSRHYPTFPDIPRRSPDRREKSGNVGSPCGGDLIWHHWAFFSKLYWFLPHFCWFLPNLSHFATLGKVKLELNKGLSTKDGIKFQPARTNSSKRYEIPAFPAFPAFQPFQPLWQPCSLRLNSTFFLMTSYLVLSSKKYN